MLENMAKCRSNRKTVMKGKEDGRKKKTQSKEYRLKAQPRIEASNVIPEIAV